MVHIMECTCSFPHLAGLCLPKPSDQFNVKSDIDLSKAGLQWYARPLLFIHHVIYRHFMIYTMLFMKVYPIRYIPY